MHLRFEAIVAEVRSTGLFIELTESLTFGFVPLASFGKNGNSPREFVQATRSKSSCTKSTASAAPSTSPKPSRSPLSLLFSDEILHFLSGAHIYFSHESF